LPLGSTCEHKDRSTAGSARFFSGEPTMSPCTRSPSFSLAPAETEGVQIAGLYTHRCTCQRSFVAMYTAYQCERCSRNAGCCKHTCKLPHDLHPRLAELAIRDEQDVRIGPGSCVKPVQAPFDGLIEVRAPIEYLDSTTLYLPLSHI
jgi:hypothetical protein